jgi:hypothetical protein
MAEKSWHLHRRTVLKGVGATCFLPLLECMGNSKLGSEAPKRLCYLYIPNGVTLPKEDSPEREEWGWFPMGEGKDYTFTPVGSCFEPYREKISVIGGLSHPYSRKLLGHIAGDTWLTGGDLRVTYKNSVSVDQVAAEHLAKHTRYPSMVLSTDGGVGYKSRSTTLSFDRSGKAIPAMNKQRDIFERFFSSGGDVEERRKSLVRGKKIVDLVLDDSRRLQRRLGKNDQRRMDEFLSSLSSVEEQVQRNERWLDVPLSPFDASHVDFDVAAKNDPEAYLNSMFDLIVLAFKIDLTRVVSFQMAREDGMGVSDGFPNKAVGVKAGHHKLSHDKGKDRWKNWGTYDQWLNQRVAGFLEKMSSTTDEFGPLLDNTLVLYGSACSNSHNARNYPLLLAGGERFGVHHGEYTVFDEKRERACNLFLSMLRAVDVPVPSFGDSTGPLPKIFS